MWGHTFRRRCFWKESVGVAHSGRIRRIGEVSSALETWILRQNPGKLVILSNLRRTVENRKFSRRKQEYQIKASGHCVSCHATRTSMGYGSDGSFPNMAVFNCVWCAGSCTKVCAHLSLRTRASTSQGANFQKRSTSLLDIVRTRP